MIGSISVYIGCKDLLRSLYDECILYSNSGVLSDDDRTIPAPSSQYLAQYASDRCRAEREREGQRTAGTLTRHPSTLGLDDYLLHAVRVVGGLG
jgi:hypothetical protein